MEAKAAKEGKGCKGGKESKEAKEAKGAKEAKESREDKEASEGKDARNGEEAKEGLLRLFGTWGFQEAQGSHVEKASKIKMLQKQSRALDSYWRTWCDNLASSTYDPMRHTEAFLQDWLSRPTIIRLRAELELKS